MSMDERLKNVSGAGKRAKEMEEQEIDDILMHLEEDMDQSFMRSGVALAELFRAVCIAAIKLPDLDLNTELMHVINSEDELKVIFHKKKAEVGAGRNFGASAGDGMSGDNYNNYDDEEEERLYDGD